MEPRPKDNPESTTRQLRQSRDAVNIVIFDSKTPDVYCRLCNLLMIYIEEDKTILCPRCLRVYLPNEVKYSNKIKARYGGVKPQPILQSWQPRAKRKEPDDFDEWASTVQWISDQTIDGGS